MITIYSVTHFLVDFACAFLMFRSISHSQNWYLCILIYNFCAFALQMPIGIIADIANRNFLFAGIGCIMICVGYGVVGVPLAATTIIGVGNGMFHIGGGVDVLNISQKKSGALGVFVSPGAFGIFFGTMLGKGETMLTLPIVLSLLTAACLIIVSRFAWRGAYLDNAAFSTRPYAQSPQSSDQNAPPAPVEPSAFHIPQRPQSFRVALFSVLCLFIVVCLRSYVGLGVDFTWKSAGYWGLALVCASAFGKASGGFLSDWLGPMSSTTITLGIATLLLLIPQYPAAGVPAMLLFNMTMPVTLWVMMKTFPGAKGFSFGLLTFALFLGFLPVYLGSGAIPQRMLTPYAALSLGVLIAGLRKARL